MAGLKSLLKDTAVYGISSIIGRLLNWLLVPMYTYVFTQTGEYGIVTNLYSYVAVALIILTYGMETGFFRFTNHERWDNPKEVYTTSLLTIGTTSVIFAIGAWMAAPSLSVLLDYGHHPEYIRMMGIAVAADAFTSIPFAYLRYQKRAYRFAALKLIGIGLNILLNIFFIIVCPWLWHAAPAAISWFYDPTFGIGYIFLANVICSLVTLLLLIPELSGLKWRFNRTLLGEMLRYSLPLLILGLAGIMNQTVDKILLPILEPDKQQAMSDLGVYGACYKVAVIMVMFLQAFRFAYEPFVFAKNREAGGDKMQTYSSVMTWFVAFGFLIFLGVMEFLPIIRYIISPTYFQGLKVVPVIMLAELFFGVFFNLSIWYKLTDRTSWGSWFSIGGLCITVTLNVLLVPRISYMGCAWAALACYSAMMTASYIIGQRKFPVPYRLGRLTVYAIAGIGLWLLGDLVKPGILAADLAIGTLLILVYVGLIYILEIQNARKSATTA
ncbi:MAG: lipopolysaccharide biosynthesis protein [Muribaculaceae bacterium]|nr:lipopolysaccharide biosynthesis protein [Muribaculaceae bacterium]